MAGLDTRGLASGFKSGFGMMDQYYTRQAQQDRADERLDMAKRQDRFQRYDANRRANFQDQKFDYRKEQNEKDREFQQEKFDYQKGIDQQKLGMQQQRINQSGARLNLQRKQYADERQRRQDQQLVESAYATLDNGGSMGDLSEEQRAAFERNPWMDPRHIGSDKVDEAIGAAEDILDPDNPEDLNSPRGLNALNTILKDRINRGEGGNKKRIVKAIPGPDGERMTFELQVTKPDGSTYREPMTANRGTGDDEEVLQVPVEDMVNQLAGTKALQPIARKAMLNYGRDMGVESVDQQPAELTERQGKQIDVWQDRAESLRKKIQNGMGTPEDKARLGQLESNIDSVIGGTRGGGGGSAGDQVVQDLTGSSPRRGGVDTRGQTGQGGEEGQRNPTAREKIAAEDQKAAEEKKAQQHKDSVNRLTSQANGVADTLEVQDEGYSPGPYGMARRMNTDEPIYGGEGEVDPKVKKKGEKLMQELLAMHDQEGTTEFQQNQIMDAIDNLRHNGVQLPSSENP